MRSRDLAGFPLDVVEHVDRELWWWLLHPFHLLSLLARCGSGPAADAGD